jgi:hypothetical protein
MSSNNSAIFSRKIEFGTRFVQFDANVNMQEHSLLDSLSDLGWLIYLFQITNADFNWLERPPIRTMNSPGPRSYCSLLL